MRKSKKNNKEFLINILMTMSYIGALIATGFVAVIGITILKIED
jgi:hypothetical protein